MSEQNYQNMEIAPRRPNVALKAIRRALGLKQSDFAPVLNRGEGLLALNFHGRSQSSLGLALAVLNKASINRLIGGGSLTQQSPMRTSNNVRG
jgi:DNA-binding transcriptional regulator YiaG